MNFLAPTPGPGKTTITVPKPGFSFDSIINWITANIGNFAVAIVCFLVALFLIKLWKSLPKGVLVILVLVILAGFGFIAFTVKGVHQ